VQCTLKAAKERRPVLKVLYTTGQQRLSRQLHIRGILRAFAPARAENALP